MIPLFKVFMTPAANGKVAEVLSSGHVAQGPRVDEFENRLTKLLDTPFDVLAVNSGTSALHLAYHLIGIELGSEVIVTPMTCAATITPLIQLGAMIVWADVQPTGAIDPDSVASLITKRTRAVIAVDWGGTPCDYKRLRMLVPTHIPIVEDAAHAMLAGRQGRSIASFAAQDNIYVCYSLQAIKHLTTGDGGLLVCPSSEATERARKLRWFGLDRKSLADFRCAQDISEAGYKFHMNDIAAAIGLANLEHLDHVVGAHQLHAFTLHQHLAAIEPAIRRPEWHEGSSWWVFTILVPDRERFQAFMAERGITTSQVHRRNDRHSGFRIFVKNPDQERSGLDSFAKQQVAIPCGWWLTQTDLERIIDALHAWAKVA